MLLRQLCSKQARNLFVDCTDSRILSTFASENPLTWRRERRVDARIDSAVWYPCIKNVISSRTGSKNEDLVMKYTKLMHFWLSTAYIFIFWFFIFYDVSSKNRKSKNENVRSEKSKVHQSGGFHDQIFTFSLIFVPASFSFLMSATFTPWCWRPSTSVYESISPSFWVSTTCSLTHQNVNKKWKYERQNLCNWTILIIFSFCRQKIFHFWIVYFLMPQKNGNAKKPYFKTRTNIKIWSWKYYKLHHFSDFFITFNFFLLLLILFLTSGAAMRWSPIWGGTITWSASMIS